MANVKLPINEINAILYDFIHGLALRKCTEMGFYWGLLNGLKVVRT